MTRVLPLLLVLFLPACGGGSAASDPRTYDLGLEAPGGRIAAVRIGAVQAIAPFDTADMFRKQLLRASGDGAGKCTLDVDIQEFSQVFSAKEASEARIDLRASVRGGASRSVTIVEPNAGADAASGAAAVARAANRAIGELGAWVGAQALCR